MSNNTPHNGIDCITRLSNKLNRDTQHNNSVMLGATFFVVILDVVKLSVIMLSVVVLIVVAPLK